MAEAKLRWRPLKAKWTLAKALAVDPLQLKSMATPQKAELAQFLRNQFSTRLNQFTTAGTVSYAVAKLAEDMDSSSKKMLMDMNPFDQIVTTRGKNRVLARAYANRKNPQNALATYITLMQDFFNSKSSTVKGWRSIGYEQDKRIFGYDSHLIRGRRHKGYQDIRFEHTPKYQMTDAERINFWRVYKELYKTDWVPITSYSSDSQREVGQLWMSGDFNKLDFDEAYAKLAELLDARPDVIKETAPGNPADFSQQDVGGGDNLVGGEFVF